MGVDRSDYILLGYGINEQFKKLTKESDEAYIDNLYDKYYDYKRKVGDIVLLEDGYSDNYTYFGVILQFDKDGYEGLSPFEYDENEYEEERDKIAKAAWEEFNISSEPKLIVLTDWH